MNLLNSIKADMESARREKPVDATKVSLLVTLYSESAMVGKNKGNRETTDQEVIAVVKKFVEGLKECIKHSSANNDSEATNKANTELVLVSKYMPKQFTEEELKGKLADYQKDNSLKDMGSVMKYFKENYPGLYDGATLSKLVKQAIQ